MQSISLSSRAYSRALSNFHCDKQRLVELGYIFALEEETTTKSK